MEAVVVVGSEQILMVLVDCNNKIESKRDAGD